MADLSTLLERNAEFAASFDKGDLPIPPNVKTIIVTCVDARVDPAHYLGLELGDALTMRTVGARITEAAITEVALLYWLVKGGSGDAVDLSVAVIGHTDCGMGKLADPEVAARFAAQLGQDVVDTYAIDDLDTTILADVARLMSDERKPEAMSVTAHVYDVKTGQVRTLEQ